MVPTQSLSSWQIGQRGSSYLFLVVQTSFQTLRSCLVVPLRFSIFAPDLYLDSGMTFFMCLCSFFFFLPALFKPRLKATSGDWRTDTMSFFVLLSRALSRKHFFLVLTRAEFAYIFHPKINLSLSTTIKINHKIPFEDPMNEYLASGFYSVVFNVYSTFSSDCLNWYLLSHPSTTVAGWSFPSFFTKGLPRTKVFYKYVNSDLSFE